MKIIIYFQKKINHINNNNVIINETNRNKITKGNNNDKAIFIKYLRK